MGKFILARKIGMSQIFDKGGMVIPVTVLEAGPCMVTQIKTQERDGYRALQLGFGRKKHLTKPLRGHLGKAQDKESVRQEGEGKEMKNFRWLREFRIDAEEQVDKEQKVGAIIDVSLFREGDIVKVSGISKGKGFQGGVKRHGFHGAPATHGTKHAHRQPGSIGASYPQRVLKGTRMAGRMGSQRVTVKNLKVVKIDQGKNLLSVKGAVPGGPYTLLEIRG